MPLSFLNPALLFGLLAASVPVIIHFLSRRRTRRVEFSDLRFLMEEESQQAKRRGIQRLLLLILRVLIVICLVLAAARPHWGGLPGGGGRAVLFLVDGSASMQAQAADGRTRFDEALGLISGMIDHLPTGSSVQVVLAGPTAQPLFAAWLPAGTAARNALVSAAVGDGPLDLAAGLREAARQVQDAPMSPVEVVLLGDLQAVSHDELDDASALLAEAGGRLLIRRLGDGVPGGGVLDVTLPGRALRPGEATEVQALVRPERANQPFWLAINGNRVAETVAPVPPSVGGAVSISFPLAVPEPGRYTGQVGKEEDRLPIDDVRPFVLSVPERLTVLLAHGADRDGLGRGGWKYLARALDPAADGQGLLQVRTMVADSLQEGDLAGLDLLVLVDGGSPGRRLGTALRHWLESGGALLAMMGDPGQEADLAEAVLPMLDLPRQASWVVRPDLDQAEHAHVVDAGHPILAGLGDTALEALGAASWQRYFAVGEGHARVILAADSGAPLLLEGELGEGRWALLPFNLRRNATDFMLNPVFLPLMQRLAAGLATGGSAGPQVQVGEPVSLPLTADRLLVRRGQSTSELVVDHLGTSNSRPASLDWRDSGAVLTAPWTERAGFFTFRSGSDTLGVVAAAVPAEESVSEVQTVADLAQQMENAGLRRVLDLGQGGADGLSRALAGRDLAPWFLAITLGLLALEVWLGRKTLSVSRQA